jgi:hypothetical protein
MVNALNALILALAAIGVGIEIAHQRTLRPPSRHDCVGQPFGGALRQCERQLPNPPRLGKPHSRSRGLAHAVHRGLGQLAQPHNQQPLGRKSRRRVDQDGLIRARFVLAALEHPGRGCLDGGVRGQQRRLRFGIGAFGGLGVGGQNGQ